MSRQPNGPSTGSESRARWTPGEDLLPLFTDGLPDTVAQRGRGCGEDLVLSSVGGNHGEPAMGIPDRLFEMSARAAPSIPADDRTAVVVRVN